MKTLVKKYENPDVVETLPINVLLIEDSHADAMYVKDMMSDIDKMPMIIEHADCLSSAFEIAPEKKFDIVLTDLGLPESDGFDTLEAVLKRFPYTPIVVLTGVNDETTGINAMKSGAQDYLVKKSINRDMLIRCIRYAIERNNLQRKNEILREEFIAMLTHDMKSSLSAIFGCASVLDKALKKKASKSEQEFINYISLSAKMIFNMINDIIESYRYEDGSTKPVLESFTLDEISADIDTAFKPQAIICGINLEISIPKNVRIMADRQMIRRVFFNLISNALKYTPINGTIKVNVHLEGDRIIAEVSDDGIGIPASDHERIFEKYVGVKGGRKGTGLGLYLVKSFLQANGSDIKLESDTNKGTRFTFSLPKPKTDYI